MPDSAGQNPRSAALVVSRGNEKGFGFTRGCSGLFAGRSGLSAAEVVPVTGGALEKHNRGGNALIRDKAKIREVADDILEETEEGHPYAVTGINEPS